LKKIGVVTSGGNAPGMNAAIRAVVRIAYSKNFQVLGFKRGWEGLITNTFKTLTPRSVGGILQLGGTILYTSRCPRFRKRDGVKKAAETLALNNVEIFKTLKENSAKGKRSGIIVATEGIGDTHKLAGEIEENTGAEVRLSILGYAQRGGNPTARSRLLSSLFADKAVELLSKEQGNRIVGLQKGRITSIKLEKSCKAEKPLDLNLLKLANILAT